MVCFDVIVEDIFSALKLGTFIFFHLRFCNSSIILSAFTGNNLIHSKQCCLVAEFTFFLLFWAAISSSSEKSNYPIRLSPKTLAWAFIFEFWVWSFSLAIFFNRPFLLNCFSIPMPRSTLLLTSWALMGWWLPWPPFLIGLGGPPGRRQPQSLSLYLIHLMMLIFYFFYFAEWWCWCVVKDKDDVYIRLAHITLLLILDTSWINYCSQQEKLITPINYFDYAYKSCSCYW